MKMMLKLTFYMLQTDRTESIKLNARRRDLEAQNDGCPLARRSAVGEGGVFEYLGLICTSRQVSNIVQNVAEPRNSLQDLANWC